MQLTRRSFLVGGFSALLGFSQLTQLGFAKDDDDRDVLVVIFLRGGCDALNLLAPVDDKNYQAARGPDLRVLASGQKQGLLISAHDKLDFRLHPSAAPLKELYDSRELAFIHAAGIPHGTRSHFDAQRMIERGASNPNERDIKDGWAARHLSLVNDPAMIPAIATSGALPESLFGYSRACCISNLKHFSYQGSWKYQAMEQKIVRQFYSREKGEFAEAALHTLDVIEFLQKNVSKAGEVKSSHYPREGSAKAFSESLETVASMVKMDIGLRMALVDCQGWDMHHGQTWKFSELAEGLSRSLAAFYSDVSAVKSRITCVVLSEFGRRVRQNDSAGTDHGHGSLMMVLGGGVNGGKMYGTWPGLSTADLDNGVDLKVTTDYRTVLAEIVQKRLKNDKIDLVFPKFTMKEDLGIVKAHASPLIEPKKI
ncbi:MAG: DUF1501 domain-containing protein [Cyanobacteria bacterium]|nr:DUF1501 domain-containing protein [Cyanobacteriota bacterium]